MATVSLKVSVAVGVVALMGAGWLGASVYSGRTVQARMADIAQAAPPASGLAFTALRHETGLLASSGQVKLALHDACARPGSGRDPFALDIAYDLSHLIGPDGLARFSWSARPSGETGAVLARLFGAEARLAGEGRVTFARAVESTIAIPELVARLPEAGGARTGEMRLAATTGRLQVAGPALSIDLGSPRLQLRGAAGQAVEANGISLDIDLADRDRGLGSVAIGADTFVLGPMRGEGLRLASSTVERADRIDILVVPSLREMRAGEQSARQLEMEFAVRNLHAPSLRALQTLVSESCDLSGLTEASRGRLREAVGTLLAQGFAAGVTRLKGSLRDGAIDGRLDVELRPAAADASSVPLQRRIRASGELSLTGSLLAAPQRQMLVAMGLALDSGSGLRASFDYADDVLRANGRTLDAALASGPLAAIEDRLAALGGSRASVRDGGAVEGGRPRADQPASSGPGGVLLPAPGGRP